MLVIRIREGWLWMSSVNSMSHQTCTQFGCDVLCCSYVTVISPFMLMFCFQGCVNGNKQILDCPTASAVTIALIARFIGPTWGLPGADRTQVGPMLAQWSLLSGWGFGIARYHNTTDHKEVSLFFAMHLVCQSQTFRNWIMIETKLK